jgi:hypothetical protein
MVKLLYRPNTSKKPTYIHGIDPIGVQLAYHTIYFTRCLGIKSSGTMRDTIVRCLVDRF